MTSFFHNYYTFARIKSSIDLLLPLIRASAQSLGSMAGLAPSIAFVTSGFVEFYISRKIRTVVILAIVIIHY